MKHVELGVFLPVAKNGFVRSKNALPYEPNFRDNLEITSLAEQLGFDYVFSMLKWRGFGGDTRYWDSSFDSFTLMVGLAALTTRIDLIATVNPLLIHPTPMAKMTATFDAISGGRAGLNIVTGAARVEYSQMGLLPENYDDFRYDYAAEWIETVKKLWTEPAVTFDGTYFHLDKCVSEPKPVRNPRPFLVCAGGSDQGLRFTAREADVSFVTGRYVENIRQAAQRSKAIAAEEGRTVKTAIPRCVILRDTASEAEAYWEHLVDGADLESARNLGNTQISQARARQQEFGESLLSDLRQITGSDPTIGGPKEVADSILELAIEADIDSFAFTFPDYLDGLRRFAAVIPLLQREIDVCVAFG